MSMIAVVDDHLTNLRILTRLAASLGDTVSVRAFADPLSALEWSQTNQPDLVITDFKMPEMDGATFIRRFRELPTCSDVPVMVITSYEDRSYRYAALEAGATDFLLSPVDHQEFRARSRNLLSLRDHQKLLKERAVTLEHRLASDTDRHQRELRESHERLLRVIDALPAMIAVTTPGARYAFINSYQAQVFGCTPDEAVGRTAVELLDSDYARKAVELDLQVFRSGDATPSFEEAFTGRNGATRTLLTTKSPVWTDGREVADVVTVSLDITERKRIAEELAAAKEVAEQASAAKSRFLAAASHDLRQPLQAGIIFYDLIARRNRDPALEDLVVKLGQSLEALEQMLNTLLDISKLEARVVQPHRTNFRLGMVLDRLADEFGPLAEAEGLEFRQARSSVTVNSDPQLLERILRNLLSNAVRYTRHGRILLGCRRSGEAVRIQVWDTGIGIPEDQIDAIFEEFHQLHNEVRDHRKGLGLGLSVVKRLAKVLGQTVSLYSRPGRGSIFEVTVPRAGVRRPTVAFRETESSQLRGRLIAVIDDDADVLNQLRMYYQFLGRDVVAAQSGASAILQLRKQHRVPDAIVANSRANGAGDDGSESIRQIRSAFGRHIPGILLTGPADACRQHGECGDVHLLHKPAGLRDLALALDDILQD